MYSGHPDDCLAVAEVIAGLSDRRFLVGDEPGMAQAVKLANNFLSATALAATNRVADLVTRVAARHPGLAGPLADVTLMHQAHADLLAEAGEASAEAAPQPVPGRSPAALALVLTEERKLQAALVEAAGGAASGTFARALASMSAAVAQQRTRLGAIDAGATP